MKVPAKTATKIAFLKTLIAAYESDKIHNQIAKLQAKLCSQETAIKELKTELIVQGQKLSDYTFERGGVQLASVKRGADSFKQATFFKQVGPAINNALGSKNAVLAMKCITDTREANTSESKTFKLKVM